MIIDLYPSAISVKKAQEMSIEDFLNGVKFGQWEDFVAPIRAEKNKKKRQKLKESCPCVTISGRFSERNVEAFEEHSGFMAIDFDEIDNLEELREELEADPYTYACSLSISGKGLFVLVKINPKRHTDAFKGLEAYYFENYGQDVDPRPKSVVSLRYVSFDPDLYINNKAKSFAKYFKETKRKKEVNVITSDEDFQEILDQIQSRGVDLTQNSYERYLRIGMGIADEFGETGRDYFHLICQNAEKYSSRQCDKQYDRCMKAKGSGVSLATFYYYCKEADIELVSEKTRRIVEAASQGKRAKRTEGSVLDYLEKIQNIKKTDAKPIVKKVFKTKKQIKSDDELSIIEKLEIFLNQNYDLKISQISKCAEIDEKKLDDIDYNSIYLHAKKVVCDSVKKNDVIDLINSDFTPQYHPLKRWFEDNKDIIIREDYDPIRAISDSIHSETQDPDYRAKMFKKVVVGLISSVFGNPCPFLPILVGETHGTGKTYFWRNLLPKELRRFYAESKLDKGKDDEILMTERLIILDDEMAGKSKKQIDQMKDVLSKEEFTLRKVFRRENVSLKRLALLVGTTNNNYILNDSTGNRRFIPIQVDSIDHKAYNEIDKTELLIYAYRLYKDGYDWTILSKEEMEELELYSNEFNDVIQERELVDSMLSLPENELGAHRLTTTEIQAHLQRITGLRLYAKKLGQELKRAGFVQKSVRRNGSLPVKRWIVKFKDASFIEESTSI